MNVEQHHEVADNQTKQTELGRESACTLLESIPVIAFYYYHYSARKLIHITEEGCIDLGIAWVWPACPRLCVAVAFATNTFNHTRWDSIVRPHTRQSGTLPRDHCGLLAMMLQSDYF